MKKMICAVVSLSLLGCSSSPYWQSNKGHKEAKAVMNQNYSWDDDAAEYVSSPIPNLAPIEEYDGPEWLQATLQEPIRISEYPFDLSVDLILRGTGVTAKFDYEMDLTLPVSLESTGTIEDALKAVSARTNYSYEIKDKIVEWHKYETEVFVLPVAGGDYSYMIGKDQQGGSGASTSGGSAGSQSIDTSAFDVDLKQYSKTEAENINVLEDAYTFARQIVGRNGNVAISKATSSVLVKTTPDRMRVVSGFMASVIDELSAQVSIEIQVVQVTTRNAGDIGVNWNGIKNITNGQLNFVSGGSGTSMTEGTPFAFSGNKNTSAGTVDLLVNALQQQGKVTFLTEQKVLSRSGKISELELGDIVGYLESSTITQSTDLGSSTELQQGIIQSGFTLYSFAKVFNNKVALVVSSRSSDLEPFEKVGTEDNFIQIPTMHSNRLNVQNLVTDGTTVVAASVRREKSSSQSASPFSSKFLPTSIGAGKEIIDIYVLVTPRIVRSL